MVVTLTVEGDRLTADFAGTSGPSAFGVNVPEVYTRAYACFALKCTIAPDVPNNAGSLEPFEITAPEGSILAARDPRRCRCATCWAIWCPTWCWARCTMRCPTRFRRRAPRRCGTSRSRCGPWTGQRDGRGDPDVQLRRHGRAARARRAVGHGLPLGRVDDERGGDRTGRPDHRLAQGPARRLRRGGCGVAVWARSSRSRRGTGTISTSTPCSTGWTTPRGAAPGGSRGAGARGTGRWHALRSKGRQHVTAGQRLRLSLPGGGGYGSPEARARGCAA
jgi:N-methylhydantoinase B